MIRTHVRLFRDGVRRDRSGRDFHVQSGLEYGRHGFLRVDQLELTGLDVQFVYQRLDPLDSTEHRGPAVIPGDDRRALCDRFKSEGGEEKKK